MAQELALPDFYASDRIQALENVDYLARSADASDWARRFGIKPAGSDRKRICLLNIDQQQSFCRPAGELYVGGRSGLGAVEDSQRLAEFVYRNLGNITQIAATLDTHSQLQIFFPSFFVDQDGQHPAPASFITNDSLRSGLWMVSMAAAKALANGNQAWLQAYAVFYTQEVEKARYQLTSWPYHTQLGSRGHALVPALEEAFFFHSAIRATQIAYQIKGGNPLTENYSIFRPEVLVDQTGRPIAQKNVAFIKMLMDFDYIIIAGQAKSHCVAWSIDDLLTEIAAQDPGLARKVYLLEDCTSPVVIPGIVDFTDQADAAFERFRAAGMNIVRAAEPMEDWPGIKLN